MIVGVAVIIFLLILPSKTIELPPDRAGRVMNEKNKKQMSFIYLWSLAVGPTKNCFCNLHHRYYYQPSYQSDTKLFNYG